MDTLLAHLRSMDALRLFSSAQIKECAQAYLDNLRDGCMQGHCQEVPSLEEIASAVVKILTNQGHSHLKPVVNATGVVLHTNLGRAPLGPSVAKHVADVAQGYCNLEYDSTCGERGDRQAHVEQLLCELSGAEAAFVVNNNAAAVFLMLHALAYGQRVAISRGELVEIGGSFRIPDIMAVSGAQLLEVGTTNKTHVEDYRWALEQEGASVLLKVHRSNFAMIGFTEDVSVQNLVALAEEHAQTAHDRKRTTKAGILREIIQPHRDQEEVLPAPGATFVDDRESRSVLVLHDLGSACFLPGAELGFPTCVSVRQAVKDGADVLCFSGDKLLGSAQAGIVLGRRELIARMRTNAFARVARIDKLSLIALERALECCREPERARGELPVLAMLTLSATSCRDRAEALCDQIKQTLSIFAAEVVPVKDEPGGGSLPGVFMDGWALALSCEYVSATELGRLLRNRAVPIVARVYEGQVLLSVRTLCEGDDQRIVAALCDLEALLKGPEGPSDAEEPGDAQELGSAKEPAGAQEPDGAQEPSSAEEPGDAQEPAGAEEPDGAQEPDDAQEPAGAEEPDGAQEPSSAKESAGAKEPATTQESVATQEPTDTP